VDGGTSVSCNPAMHSVYLNRANLSNELKLSWLIMLSNRLELMMSHNLGPSRLSL
jgi:hypothetical protein